jgi:type VI protein secretion system component VasK
VAEVLLLLAAIAVPLLLGVATAYIARPWWWGALVSVAVFLVAAIAPEPEEGEARVSGGDLAFLLIVSLFVAGLTWLGAWAGRRWLRRTRT